MNNQRWKIGDLSHIGTQSFCQLNFIYMRLTNHIHTQFQFRESRLLYNEAIHTDLRKLQVTTVISHEFAHQVRIF